MTYGGLVNPIRGSASSKSPPSCSPSARWPCAARSPPAAPDPACADLRARRTCSCRSGRPAATPAGGARPARIRLDVGEARVRFSSASSPAWASTAAAPGGGFQVRHRGGRCRRRRARPGSRRSDRPRPRLALRARPGGDRRARRGQDRATRLAGGGPGVASPDQGELATRRWRLIGPWSWPSRPSRDTVFAHQVMPSASARTSTPSPAHRFLTEHLGTDRYAGQLGWGYAPTSMLYDLGAVRPRSTPPPGWTSPPGDRAEVRPQTHLLDLPGAVETADVSDLPILDQARALYFAASRSVVGTVVVVTAAAPLIPVGDQPAPVRGAGRPGAWRRGHRRDQPRRRAGRPGCARRRAASGTVLEGTRALEEDLTRGAAPRAGSSARTCRPRDRTRSR